MNILFLGCGKMGSVILGNIIEEKSAKTKNITILEKNTNLAIDGVKTYLDITELESIKYKANLIFIAIKPQNCQDTLLKIAKSSIISKDTIFISVLAGKKINFFEKIFSDNAKIVRSMPNLAISDSQGVFLYQKNKNIDDFDQNKLNKIFNNFGLSYQINDENLFDVLTAICGSGPAYIFLLQNILKNILNNHNINEKDSENLVNKLFLGTSLMSNNIDKSFLQLKQDVTSKGGTTEAGLEILESKNELEKLFTKAINNAINKSKELS